jgi:hypothetical protein
VRVDVEKWSNGCGRGSQLLQAGRPSAQSCSVVLSPIFGPLLSLEAHALRVGTYLSSRDMVT